MDQATEVRESENLDWIKLEEYLQHKLKGSELAMDVKQFKGGHANLTYLITYGPHEYVLRRPPFGKIAPGAHDMGREFKVLSKIYDVFPAAPRAYLYEEDAAIIGAPFIVMERRNGVVIRRKIPEGFSAYNEVENALSIALMKCEASFHMIDVEKAGLSDLGKPVGFLERQLKGWTKRWSLCKTEESPLMDEILSKLAENVPIPQRVSLVHNDIKLDNCQFNPKDPTTVTSLFDWDMTTIGDPLVDLGVTLAYWPDEKLDPNMMPIGAKGNWPSKDFLKKEYGERTGLDLSNVGWYETLGLVKVSVIAEQLFRRYVDGDTKDQRMKHLGMMARVLINLAGQKLTN